MARVIVERENVNDEFVVIRKIYKESGSVVAADNCVLEIETSKTIREVVAPEGGIVKIALLEGDEVDVGELLFEVLPESAAGFAGPAIDRETAHLEGSMQLRNEDTSGGKREFSRAAAELVQRLGIETDVLPTGWIVTADVIRAIAAAPAAGGAVRATVARPSAANMLVAPSVPFRPERMSLRKRIEARNLTLNNGSGSNSAVGIDVLLRGPRLIAPPFLFRDSITDLVVFESAKLLRGFPDLNAFHLDERTIGYFEEINLGISFDKGHDLKVLALRNADILSLAQVQSGIEHLLDLYESAAPIDDSLLNGSTVTISDLSRSAVHFMLPLLNANQSLIIGITRPRPELYVLHAVFDHRVSEGLQVAKFLGGLRQRIESHHRSDADNADSLRALRCSVCEQTLQQEFKLGRKGLVRVLLPSGAEGYLCRNCFDGW
jgi:pyruvate/2-oxoglutarate dehydrogenase complex dihydrolipoamide acyltransferase (E2) component